MTAFLNDITLLLHDPYVAFIVLCALVFDFINGFHDAANSIATIVGTRVMRPFTAVFWAAWWNFAAAWFFGVHVANTVASWVKPEYVNTEVILAGLIGAIVWDLITWHYGLPTSSSHALLGGFCGAAVTYAGSWVGVLNSVKVITTIEFIVIAPFIGFALALVLVVLLIRTLWRVSGAKMDSSFRVIQLASAAAYSLGHGTNDAQKTMGIIAALLYASIWKNQQAEFAAGHVTFPFWIVLVCHLAISLGTLSGGWRIVKTMGMKLTRLKPWGGACAETAAAVALFATAKLGIPVSTTHTITGAIVGVGAVQRVSAVRWGIARRVVWAWVFTIPAAGIVGCVSYLLIHLVQTVF